MKFGKDLWATFEKQKHKKRRDKCFRKKDSCYEEPYEDRSSKSRSVAREDLNELPGNIFNVGNVHLNIPREKSLWHPCAVTDVEESNKLALSKGTDAFKLLPRYASRYVTIRPDSTNGLSKLTAFDGFLKWVGHKRLFVIDQLGRLSEKDFMKLKRKVQHMRDFHA